MRFRPGDFDFTGDWYGWRLRGPLLLSPHGDRITRTRLDGLLWSESLRVRYQPQHGQMGRIVAVEGPPAAWQAQVQAARK